MLLDDFIYGEPRSLTSEPTGESGAPVPGGDPHPRPTVQVAPQPGVDSEAPTGVPRLNASPVAAAPASPTLTGLKVTFRKATYTLTAPAPVRIVIERRTKTGRFEKTKTRIHPAGPLTQTTKLGKLSAGRYRITARVKDPAGNTLSTMQREFTVPAKR